LGRERGNRMPKFLTPDEVCARWKGILTPGTLANWRNQGKGPKYVKMGGKILYKEDDIEEFEKSKEMEVG